jgi:arylsulfatase A-like enzyme
MARAMAMALALALALALAACGEQPTGSASDAVGAGRNARGPGPSLLLVTFDTTRADRIGAYGDADAETPALDALAARGLLYERAYAAAPITLPSHATLLSGLYPHEHGARDNGLYRVPDEVLLLPEALAAGGWRTGAFLGSVVLSPRYGLDQGFEVYDVPVPGRDAGDGEEGVERAAGAVVDAALAWLDTVPADQRFLLWVHLFDPHARYEPPEPYAARHADPYDGEIAYADSQLGRLLAVLAERGRDADLAVIATADHGESLGEHGEPTHGIFLYDATMRVPLIVVPPGALREPPSGAARRVTATVSLADVPATVLDLLGLPAAALPAARTPSLLRSADATESGGAGTGAPESGAHAGDPDAPGGGRAVYLESLLPFHQHRWRPLRGLAWDGSKLIDSEPPELYVTADDPGERDDRAAAQPARVAAARASMAALLARQRAADVAATAPAEYESEQHEAIGNVGAAEEGDTLYATMKLPR